VNYREASGSFPTRQALTSISGFGPKAFQQAAGFLRVPGSSNPLDNSSVHPERYEILEQIAQDQKTALSDFVGNKALVEAIPLEKYVTAQVGMPTLRDIAAELIKPGRDPREDGARLMFSDDVAEIEDLKIDMVLKGTVTNVTNFGAFVDIGVHQDGLVHISELSETFVNDPSTVIAVGQVVEVRVLDVDIKRRRISLSRKLKPQDRKGPAPAATEGRDNHQGQNGRAQGHRPPQRDQHGASRDQRGGARPAHDGRGRGPGPGRELRDKRPQFTLEDLVNKFNVRK